MASESENQTEINLSDLNGETLVHILSFLGIPDICRAAQVSRAFQDASLNDRLWHHKALGLYPPSTVTLGPSDAPHYNSYRSLIVDDNRLNATLHLPLHHASCDFKHASPRYYFECIVTNLQYDRKNDRLRVFFDARGEHDLREPLASSLGVTVAKHHPNRWQLRQRRAHLKKTRQELTQLIDTLTPQLTTNPDAALRHHNAHAALKLACTRLNAVNNELHDGPPIGFADLITVIRPSSSHYVIATPGHYKGYLEFNKISSVESLAKELPESYRLKREVTRVGMDIVFCYANPLPVMPHDSMTDYHSCQLLYIPPAFSVEKAMLRLQGGECPVSGGLQSKYADLDQVVQEVLMEESEEEALARWGHVEVEMREAQRSFSSWLV